jgi:hypothetical protein
MVREGTMAGTNDIEKRKSIIEPAQALYSYRYDFAKHLTTLSSGGILFVSAFLAIKADATYANYIVYLSMASFGLSMIISLWQMLLLTRQSGLLGYFALTGNDITLSEANKKRDRHIMWFNRIAVGLFLVGIILAAIFFLTSGLRGQ